MKKLGLFMVGVILSVTSFGQRTAFGLKGGVNIASIKNESHETDPVPGIHVGGLAHIHVAPSWAVQPEVVFSVQGAESPGVYKTRLNYVNVPVLLQYMTKGGLRLQTGPQLGIRVMHETENYSGMEIDWDDKTKQTDVAWTAGVGYLTRSGLGFDARYNHGLSNITTDDANYEAKNRVWQLGLFYQFGKK